MSDWCDSATSDDSFDNSTNSSDSGVAVFSSGQADCLLLNHALAALEEKPACSVRELAGKGIAMMAERRLFPGDIILSEPTVLVMPVAVFDGGREGTDDWLERKINRLGSGQRELLLSLTDWASPADPTYIGRFYTNCMSWGEDVAMFPLMARANHSCRPNAEFVARLDTGKPSLPLPVLTVLARPERTASDVHDRGGGGGDHKLPVHGGGGLRRQGGTPALSQALLRLPLLLLGLHTPG
jgi:hypothetical protein